MNFIHLYFKFKFKILKFFNPKFDWIDNPVGRCRGTSKKEDFLIFYKCLNFINYKVYKISSSSGTQPKRFKSGSKINTIKGVINHPFDKKPAFTFYEDDSYVHCYQCVPFEK